MCGSCSGNKIPATCPGVGWAVSLAEGSPPDLPSDFFSLSSDDGELGTFLPVNRWWWCCSVSGMSVQPRGWGEAVCSGPLLPAQSWVIFKWVIFCFFLELLGHLTFYHYRNPDAEKILWFFVSWISKPIVNLFIDQQILSVFSDLKVVTETLFLILVTFHQLCNSFLSKAWFDFGQLQGKPQLLAAHWARCPKAGATVAACQGLPKGWGFQGFLIQGCTWWELPQSRCWWDIGSALNLKSGGSGFGGAGVFQIGKKRGFEIAVLYWLLIHVLFLHPGWNSFLYCRKEKLFFFNLVAVLSGLPVSPVDCEKVPFW